MAHPENTFRALTNQPQFVDRWQCRVGLHRYSPWTDLEDASSSIYKYQKRNCVYCNYQTVHRVNTM